MGTKFSADALRVAMARRAVTDAELARLMGVRRQRVKEWTGGSHAPSADALARIADALKCGLEEFYIREITKCPA